MSALPRVARSTREQIPREFDDLVAPGHPLTTASGIPVGLNPLPRVTALTRAALVAEIDQRGSEAFIRDAIQALEDSNPGLLQMAHNFVSE
jgi:hypothetical protein